MIPSQKWPILHLEEETATAADLHSYLRGFIALKVRAGLFIVRGTGVLVVPTDQNSFVVRVTHDDGNYRIFVVRPDDVQVARSTDPPPRDTVGFHAWFITSLLAAHLKSCFQEREAAAS